jgi:hypothetical protein
MTLCGRRGKSLEDDVGLRDLLLVPPLDGGPSDFRLAKLPVFPSP